jgi:hypothetical protein
MLRKFGDHQHIERALRHSFFMRGDPMAGNITALPSVIIMPDGSEKELDSFSREERQKWDTKMCQRVGSAISELYADSPEEWNTFVRNMTS